LKKEASAARPSVCTFSQSAVTRQIQLLEHDLGGQILERASSGVRPTDRRTGSGAESPRVVGRLRFGDAEIRRLVRGESDRLRIGYLASAMQEYFGPALAKLRRAYPKLKVKMLDQTPGEIITALRGGEIDLALTVGSAGLLSRDFYTRN